MHPQLAKLFSGALELWLESRRKTHSPFFQVNICSNEVAWAFCIYIYIHMYCSIRYICICIIIFVFNPLSWIFAAFRCIASSIWEIVGASQQLNQPLTQRFRRFRWFCLRKMRMIWIHLVEGFSANDSKTRPAKILCHCQTHMLFVSNFVTVKMKQDFVQQKTLDPHSFQADTDAETKLSCSAR